MFKLSLYSQTVDKTLKELAIWKRYQIPLLA